MRLKVVLGESDAKVRLRRDYRRYFMSFLKDAFTKSGVYRDLYSTKTLKPFTFSVYLGDDFKILEDNDSEEIEANLPFHLIFSTGDPVIFAQFYNGVLYLKESKKGITLPKGQVIPIKDILLAKDTKIKSSHVVFRTTNVCVLTDPDQSAKDFDKWYTVPENGSLDRFEAVLKRRVFEKYEILTGKRAKCDLRFTPCSNDKVLSYVRRGVISPSYLSNSIKEVVVEHYGGFLKGFKGVFHLESCPEILQFIYDYGLGVKTGQGFGLLEVVEQI